MVPQIGVVIPLRNILVAAVVLVLPLLMLTTFEYNSLPLEFMMSSIILKCTNFTQKPRLNSNPNCCGYTIHEEKRDEVIVMDMTEVLYTVML